MAGGRRVPPQMVNHAAVEHSQLKQWTDDADTETSQAFADEWTRTGSVLTDAAESLKRAALGTEAGWAGEAADAMRARLGQIATWSGGTGAQVTGASQTISRQSEAADVARRAMPEPVSYNPADIIRDAPGNGLLAIVALPQLIHQRYEQSNAAHEEAVRVVSGRDNAMSSAAGQVSLFQAPPRLDGSDDGDPGDGGRDSGKPESGGPRDAPRPRGSKDDVPRRGEPGGGSPGSSGGGSSSGGSGGVSGGDSAGVTTPGAFTPQAPAGVGGAGASSGSGAGSGPVGGLGEPGGGFGDVSGSRRFGGGARRGFGSGEGAGGRGAVGEGSGGRGAFGAGGRGAVGEGGGARGVGPGAGKAMPGSMAAAEAAAVRGGRGGPVGGMPMGGAGRRDDDAEHQRPEFLQEPDPEGIFDSDVLTAPSVIGGPDDE